MVYICVHSGPSSLQTLNLPLIPAWYLCSLCRQLEAVIRITESLAKMQLKPFATEGHVDEALRLFQVSTLDAARTGSLAGES